MSTASKVTLGFVILFAMCFWYFAMRTLKTHQAWRTNVTAHRDRIEEVEKKTTDVLEGDPEKGRPSLGGLQIALDTAIFGRGRAWMDCSPRFDPATGNVEVTVNQPPDQQQPRPHQIETNMVCHAFQGLDEPGGRYMGEFKVTAVDGNRLTLAPTYTPSEARKAVLQQALPPWALYEVLPTDKNELFATLNEDAIRDLLPAPPRQLQGESNDDFQARQLEHETLVQEYLQDNKKINPEDPPEPERVQVLVKFVKDETDLNDQAKAALRQIDFGQNLVKSGIVMKVDLPTANELVRLGLAQEVERRYQRKLRDYSYLLREFHRELPLLEDHIANMERDRDYMIEANQQADDYVTECRNKDETMRKELALVEKEGQVVSDFRNTLQERLDKVNADIARLREENKRLAAQLAKRQLEAVQNGGRSASSTALVAPR
jgi:hypothetical protein